MKKKITKALGILLTASMCLAGFTGCGNTDDTAATNSTADTATTNDVLLHAVDFYEKQGKHYSKLLLLQPTSPLRKVEEVKDAIDLYRDDIDMVVSVMKSHAPAVLCNDNEEGFVELVYNKNAFLTTLLVFIS